MHSDPEGTVEAAMTAYALGDYETALAFYAADASFAFFADNEIFPFAGECHGREAILKCWQEIGAAFDIQRFETRSISSSGNRVRSQVDYELVHRDSGETIDGVARFIFDVKGGLIVREREYNDVARLRAFMRICSHANGVMAEVSAQQP